MVLRPEAIWGQECNASNFTVRSHVAAPNNSRKDADIRTPSTQPRAPSGVSSLLSSLNKKLRYHIFCSISTICLAISHKNLVWKSCSEGQLRVQTQCTMAAVLPTGPGIRQLSLVDRLCLRLKGVVLGSSYYPNDNLSGS